MTAPLEPLGEPNLGGRMAATSNELVIRALLLDLSPGEASVSLALASIKVMAAMSEITNPQLVQAARLLSQTIEEAAAEIILARESGK